MKLENVYLVHPVLQNRNFTEKVSDRLLQPKPHPVNGGETSLVNWSWAKRQKHNVQIEVKGKNYFEQAENPGPQHHTPCRIRPLDQTLPCRGDGYKEMNKISYKGRHP